MDDLLCRQFFLQPQLTNQRRYEALRSYFVNGPALAEIADRLGYQASSLKSMVCRFRASCAQGNPTPFFFPKAVVGPQGSDRRKTKGNPNRPPSPTLVS